MTSVADRRTSFARRAESLVERVICMGKIREVEIRFPIKVAVCGFKCCFDHPHQNMIMDHLSPLTPMHLKVCII